MKFHFSMKTCCSWNKWGTVSLTSMSVFLPNDNDNYQTIDNYLLNIHIDFSNDDSTFIIHEIKSSSIDLRGESFNVDLNFLEFNYLLQDAAANVDDTNAIWVYHTTDTELIHSPILDLS